MIKAKSHKKNAIYMRVSTLEQDVEPQRLELLRWAAGNGVEIPESYVFVDHKTGKTWSRTGIDRMTRLIEEGKIGLVICAKLDRIGRSLRHLVNLIHLFDTYQCAVVATSQGIDTRTNSPTGRMHMGILMVIAEFENSLISERTKAGLEVARRKGVKLGRKPKPLPKNWQETVSKWREEGGKSFRTLAKRLGGTLSLSTVYNLVHRGEGESGPDNGRPA